MQDNLSSLGVRIPQSIFCVLLERLCLLAKGQRMDVILAGVAGLHQHQGPDTQTQTPAGTATSRTQSSLSHKSYEAPHGGFYFIWLPDLQDVCETDLLASGPRVCRRTRARIGDAPGHGEEQQGYEESEDGTQSNATRPRAKARPERKDVEASASSNSPVVLLPVLLNKNLHLCSCV